MCFYTVLFSILHRRTLKQLWLLLDAWHSPCADSCFAVFVFLTCNLSIRPCGTKTVRLSSKTKTLMRTFYQRMTAIHNSKDDFVLKFSRNEKSKGILFEKRQMPTRSFVCSQCTDTVVILQDIFNKFQALFLTENCRDHSVIDPT